MFDPVLHYPSHEQDNRYFVQQYGYLLRPLQSTIDGIAVAVANVAKLPKRAKRHRRPLPKSAIKRVEELAKLRGL